MEEIARQLANHLDYVDYDTKENISADIQYYISFHRARMLYSPVNIGWFTHIEDSDEGRERYFSTARRLDYCVCHSKPYEKLLKKEKIKNVVTIHPGVDLDKFRPKLRIGVVGRTYASGRKGEELINRLFDIEDVEWKFTGSGWPGISRNYSDSGMVDFYNSIDCLLITATNEAGPMSVVEALACGKTVISPEIGWVNEFPHISYKAGDEHALRKIINGLKAERSKLRKSVLSTTWENFALKHDQLFTSLLKKSASFFPTRLTQDGPLAANYEKAPFSVKLVLAAKERQATGGPSVRVPKLARCLRASGIDAMGVHTDDNNEYHTDVSHLYNINPVPEAYSRFQKLQHEDTNIVFSPILLDTHDRQFYKDDLVRFFADNLSTENLNESILELYSNYRSDDINTGSHHEMDAMRYIVSHSDGIVYLSEFEKELMHRLGAGNPKECIIRNPINIANWKDANPDLFYNEYGVKDFVLCVGRIEPRKNQLMLILALRDTGIPLVLMGRRQRDPYNRLCETAAGNNVIFIDHLPQGHGLLASAFKAAKCFVLPSWAEGAPIAALEAAASGCRLVLSCRSSEREYFGDFAKYIEPSSMQDIKEKVISVYETTYDSAYANSLIEHVDIHNSYEAVTSQHIDFYQKFSRDRLIQRNAEDYYYFDITQNAHTDGITGTSRVEYELVRHMKKILPSQIVLVVWNKYLNDYVECSFDDFFSGNARRHRDIIYDTEATRLPIRSGKCYSNSKLIVLGGGWIGSNDYIGFLSEKVIATQIQLVTLVHDVIQSIFDWYPEDRRWGFDTNLILMSLISKGILTNSRQTDADYNSLIEKFGIVRAPSQIIPFGEELNTEQAQMETGEDNGNLAQSEKLEASIKSLGKYVLYVSTIDVRKNHKLLADIWQRLIDSNPVFDTKLVLVGKEGWHGDESMKHLEKIKSHLLILSFLDDHYLSQLIRSSLFVVFPSLYEGWGLPVSEALSMGKVVVFQRSRFIKGNPAGMQYLHRP